MKWYFACESDLHFGQSGTSIKPFSVGKLINENAKQKIDFVICDGDLTDTASDGCCCSKSVNELSNYIDNYVAPLEINGIQVKATIGNHDINRQKHPCANVMKYIRNKYNATYSWTDPDMSGCYSFMHNGVQFISLGVYPKNLNWLKSVLPVDRKNPIVIFYHYNTYKNEPFGDWWTETEKLAFYDIIKNYNVLTIVNGHWHTSCITDWNGIRIIHGAHTIALVEMDDAQLSKITFIK